ncbi:6701_t:CDS:2 [Ambispora gerdemannii]|uniref:6701_t:CDS:1 n=1 Tax=Ambispora gerdemannii TaxID=144530 RepID=A0A9N8ZFB7_9GLOM|nr:6701_t:CDS:2 [Ambispora gerdemannii]
MTQIGKQTQQTSGQQQQQQSSQQQSVPAPVSQSSQQQSEASTSILIPELIEENTNNVLGEAPPSYEEALAASISNNNNITSSTSPTNTIASLISNYTRPLASSSQQTTYHQYSPFMIPPDDPNTTAIYYPGHHNHDDLYYSHTQHSFIEPVFVARNWLALIYLLLWDLAFACFCFSWVIGTLVTGVVLLIIPPVGYVVLLGAIYSWRMLARVELASLNSISNHATERTHIPSTTYRLATHTSQDAITHFFSLLSDEFTLRSILYFTTIKFAMSITFFTISIIAFALGLTFCCCFLPASLLVSRTLVNLEATVARKALLV